MQYAAMQSTRSKYFLLKKKQSSLEYFHREDVITTPIDAPLIRHKQTARSRDKKKR